MVYRPLEVSQTMREITLQVEPTTQAPRLSRGQLAEIRSALEPKFDDVAVVISELVTNSVRYGTGTDDISVQVEASEDRIRVEVSDSGPGFDKDAPRGDGMGLDIVDRIADRWGVSFNSRCTVWAEIARED